MFLPSKYSTDPTGASQNNAHLRNVNFPSRELERQLPFRS